MIDVSKTRRRPIIGWLILLLILLFILLIFILTQFQPGEAAGFTPCRDMQVEPVEPRTVLTEATTIFPRSIILSGNVDDFELIAERVVESNPALFGGTTCATPRLVTERTTAPLRTERYELPEGTDSWAFVEAFYAELIAANQERPSGEPIIAFADVNHVFGYAIEGDPSNSHSGIGSGIGAQVPFSGFAASNDPRVLFEQQWALGSRGGGIGYDELREEENPPTGAGVNVIVFDTSPFATAGNYGIPWAYHQGFAVTVTVPDTMPVYTYPPAPNGVIAQKLNVAEHGLFAAGLINGIAPDANIEIVRILDEHGQGDLFTLMKMIELRTDAATGPTVFNLSLGILTKNAPIPEDILEQYAELAGEYAHLGEDNVFAFEPYPIPGFQWRLVEARNADIVVVAATGNDSNHNEIAAVQLPAGFPQTIAVGGHNYLGERSCFSNGGADVTGPAGAGDVSVMNDRAISPESRIDVAAWAATLGGNSHEVGNCDAQSITAVCSALALEYNYANQDLTNVASIADFAAQFEYLDCPLAVLSTVSQETDSTGYVYWIGTSFSTPLVAGLAALLFEETPSLTPLEMFDIIAPSTAVSTADTNPFTLKDMLDN